MTIYPEMISVARESRGLSQGELAKRIGIKQSTLSKYEGGISTVPSDLLGVIASELNYPESVFHQGRTLMGLSSACLFHRKRQSVPVSVQRKNEARAHLKRLQLESLLSATELSTTYDFPNFDLSDHFNSPSQVAAALRRYWNLPMGPIRNLVEVIESAGGIVVPFNFGTRNVDAMSLWPKELPPLFFLNEEMPWDRIRFTLAHEIAHLVMHDCPSAETEKEADEFASAFLMPEQEIRPYLFDLDIQKAFDLKPLWKVSIQALIRRAHDLKCISDKKYKSLYVQISQFGYRRDEPLKLLPEKITVLPKLIDFHLTDLGYTVSELSSLVKLCEAEFQCEFLPHPSRPIRIK